MRALPVALCLGLGLLAGAVSAADIGRPAPTILSLPYDPDRVTPLRPAFGYEMMLRFGADERIENVAIGEGSTWQITPNKNADLIFLKPMIDAVRTNMTVVTDKRIYLFDLTPMPAPRGGGGVVYEVRFVYPPPPPSPPPPAAPPAPHPPERRNLAYAYAGARELAPSLVFDDGRFTYFQWPAAETAPAVFVVGPDGKESLAEYSHRDGYEVVEQLAPAFRLRLGRKLTTVVNEAWKAPAPGADAPRLISERAVRDLLRREGLPS